MWLDELQGRFDELEQRLSRLTLEHAALQKRYTQLEEKSRKQQQRISELEEQLAKARKTSRNSSKPPSSDIVKKPPPAAALPEGGRRKRGGQPGHPRHTRPDMTPDEIHDVIDCSLDVCPCCGEKLVDLDRPPDVLHQIELPKKPTHTTEHRRYTKRCRKCDKEFTPAWPPGLLEAGLIGPRLTSLVGFLKGACGMTISALRRFFRDVLQVKVSKGFLAKLVNKVSGSLADPYEELLRLLPDEDLLNIDETGHKDGGKRLWTWCFRAALFSLFKISPSRGSDVLLEVLGKEFDGVIGCDYFSAYRKYMRLNDNVRVQFCLAHLIRDVKFLAEHPDAKNRAYGQSLLALLRKLFGIIHRRDEYATPAGFRTALARVRTDLVWAATMDSPQTREAAALEERFYRYTESYFQFLTDPDIDPTNNVVEQAFRFVAIQRRITQGTRGQTGQTWSERIWTAVATCEQQGRSIFDYLVAAVVSHFTHQPYPSLVPEPSNSS
jgi:transposase